MNKLNKDLESIRKKLDTMQRFVGNAVERYTHDAFKNAKWDKVAWNKRKSKNKSDRRNKDNPRALMIQTRSLQRSIQVTVTKGIVKVQTNITYAQIHNEGGTINHPGGTPYANFNNKFGKNKKRGRIGSFGNEQMIFLKKDGKYPKGVKFTKPHPIRIPKRQFMGYSKELVNKIEDIINKTFEL